MYIVYTVHKYIYIYLSLEENSKKASFCLFKVHSLPPNHNQSHHSARPGQDKGLPTKNET